MAPRYAFSDGPDGSPCILMSETALPCPGVALRMNAVIDCRPGEERMPPITIEILKNLAPEQQGDGPQLAGRFTCDCGDFVLLNQIRRVEVMVEEAGLPPECAPSLTCFFHQSASSGTNTFFKAMAITVEAGDPGSIVVDEYEDEDKDEEVPPGANAGECAICYRVYLVGGDTSARLACGHAFHRWCLDRWTSVRRTCPYCRAPVPEELEYWDDEDGDEKYHAEYGDEEYRAEYGDEEYRAGYYGGDMPPPGDGEEERQQVPGGETPSADAVWGSPVLLTTGLVL